MDVNLDGRMSYPIAEIVKGRGIPMIFATGYGAAGLDPPYNSWLVIKKPFRLEDLHDGIQRATALAGLI